MKSEIDIIYEVIDPVTQENFVTADRYVAEHHYEKGYTVNETHRTMTRLSPFSQTRLYVVSCWNDEDSEDVNPEIKEA